jgi:solute:Na+ symporter, SSS family
MNAIRIDSLDLAIIGAYFLIVFAIGGYLAWRTRSADDLFLAGRRLGWLPIGLSLFASNISSTTLIGLMGAAYTWGLAVANYEWMAAPLLVVFAVFLIPLYLRSRIATVPEYLERRFDWLARRYFSAMTLVSNIVVDTAGTLFAGAIVLATLVPGLDIFTAALILAAIAGIYTAAGGLAAVVYTDVLQAIVLLIGASLVTFFSLQAIDFDWGRVVAETHPDQLSLFLPMSDPNLPWLGVVVGVPVLGFYFWCTNQFVVQRVLGARDIENARWGALLAGFLKLSVLFIMVIPGVVAILIIPGLEQSDQVFPALIAELLPAGVRGLVLAALVAALMSSIDSTLNSAATLLTLDFVKPLRPNLTPRQTVWIGRIAILFFMLISAAVAPLIGGFEGLFHYLQTALSYLVPPVAALFLIGALWARPGPRAALATLLGGHAVSAVLFVLTIGGGLNLHFTLVAGILFAVSASIFVVAGLLESAPSAARAGAVAEMVWRPALVRPTRSGPWWSDYRLQSAGLLVLTGMLVIGFR